MKVSLRLPSVLRPYAGGSAVVSVEVDEPATLADVLDRLEAQHPGVGRRLRDEQGALRPHVNVFVGADNVRDLEGLRTEVTPASELSVLPAVSGG